MSTVFVGPNQQFTAADPGLFIFGGSGSERVRLTADASNASVNPNVETVDFASPVSSFTFQVTGNVVLVRQAGGVIASIVVQDDADGTRLRFTDGGADLRITGLNQVTLGGVAVTTANGGAGITQAQMGANFSAADPSSLSGSGPTVTEGQSFTISEGSSNNAAVGTVLATDPDTTAPGNTLSYSIVAGDSGGAFKIDPNTGAISVADASKLDFETGPNFNLTVKATDGTSLSDTAVVTVNLSDANDAPRIDAGQTLSVAKQSITGTNFGSVIATDPDATAPNNTLSFAITGGNTGGAFAINSGTGALTVADAGKLTAPSFALNVTATDMGSPTPLSSSSVVTVIVDENQPPVVAANQLFAVGENAANGDKVGTVVATDLDTATPNKTLSFAIVMGNTDTAFKIDAATGVISVNDKTKLGAIDSIFNLKVVATDGGGLSDDDVVTVKVSDTNEAPTVTDNQTFNLDENSIIGVVAGTVIATDPDPTAPNKTLSFSIIEGNTNNAFEIDAVSGAIKVKDASKIDFETTPTFSLKVKATDAGGLSDDSVVKVTLKDKNEAPVINDVTLSLNENSANASLVGAPLVASDPDTTAPNKTLSFSITGGNDLGAFDIDAITGQIKVKDTSKLDFETNPDFSLTVTAKDAGDPNLSDTALVKIGLKDVNDAPIATDDAFILTDASTVTLPFSRFLDNDIDQDADTLAITAASPVGSDNVSGVAVDPTAMTLSFTTKTGVNNVQGRIDYVVSDSTLTDTGSTTILILKQTSGADTLDISAQTYQFARLDVGSGDDTVTGGQGVDLLFGGPGKDTLSGGLEDDALEGGIDDDTLNGDDGDDSLSGGDGVDLLSGGVGKDTLSGGAGNDVLSGGNDDDVLNGDDGNDSLFGNDGADVFFGGTGTDSFTGGDGNDQYKDAGLGASETVSVLLGDDRVFFTKGSAFSAVSIFSFDADAAGGQDIVDLDAFFDDLGFADADRQFGAGINVVGGSQLFIDKNNSNADGFEFLAATFTVANGALDAPDFFVGSLS